MLPNVKVNVTEEVITNTASLNTFLPLVILKTKTGPIGTEVLIRNQRTFAETFGIPDSNTPEAYGIYKYINTYGSVYVVRVAAASAANSSGTIVDSGVDLVLATSKYKTDELNGKDLKLIYDGTAKKIYLSLVINNQTITSVKESLDYSTATADIISEALDSVVESFNEAQNYLVVENKFIEKTSEDTKPAAFTELTAAITGGISGNTGITDEEVNAIVEHYRGSDIGIDAILAPGLESTAVVNKLANVADDSSFVAIASVNGTVSSIKSTVNAYNPSASLIVYAGQVYENDDVAIPASVAILPAYITRDQSSKWLAPAGVTRGTLTLVTSLVTSYSDDELEVLYTNTIPVNGIKRVSGRGFIVWGQKTAAQDTTQYEDRANVVRLIKYLTKEVNNISYDYLFEPITSYTYNSWILRVEAILDEIKQGSGLSEYRVIMDDTINTDETKAQNKLIGIVRLKPLEAAEFIEINFTITDNVEGGNA